MSDPTDPSRNPQRDFAVGLTVVVALVVLAILIMSFAGVKNLVRRGYDVTVHLPRAQGLAAGSTVYLAGIPVGTVGRVVAERNANGTYGVRATARIDQDITLPATTTVELNEQILGGVARLIFFADAVDPAGKTLPKDNSAQVMGKRSNLAIEMADNIMGGGSSGVGGLMGDTHALILSLKKTTDLIGRNFDPVDPQQLAKGEVAPNIHTLIARMNALVAHTDEVVGDPQMRDDLRATLTAAKEVATSAKGAIGTVTQSITSLSQKVGATVDATGGEAQKTLAQLRQSLAVMQEKYGALADEMNKTTAGVNAVLSAINQGKGTAGKLVHDPALYENLNDSVQRLDKAFEEVRLLVEKFKREGVDLKIK